MFSIGFVNSATVRNAPARLPNAGARLLKRSGSGQVRLAVRTTVGEELVCLGGDAGRVLGIGGASVESGCGVLCFAERLVRWLKKALGWVVLVL